MMTIEPQIFLVGETKVNTSGLEQYLKHINVQNWTTNAPTDIEYLSELFGRGCYKSYEIGPNLNISKIRKGNDTYLDNILKSGHGSVLEHGWLNWMLCGVSRVFTHELVRHRVGTAISQESLRFVRTNEIGFWAPKDLEVINTQDGTLTLAQVELTNKILIETVRYLEGQTIRLNETLNLDNIKSFDIKKRLTTIVRRILPEGLATNIGWSCNIRTLRHLIEMRTSRHSEEEIRLVFGKIGCQVKERFPNLFKDYKIEEINGLPEFTTEYRKV